MSSSVLDMSMSLDGYIADLNGERLHSWADADGQSGPAQHFQAEWNAGEVVRVIDTPQATHLYDRVRR